MSDYYRCYLQNSTRVRQGIDNKTGKFSDKDQMYINMENLSILRVMQNLNKETGKVEREVFVKNVSSYGSGDFDVCFLKLEDGTYYKEVKKFDEIIFFTKKAVEKVEPKKKRRGRK